jgi:nicotinamidase-related amidase
MTTNGRPRDDGTQTPGEATIDSPATLPDWVMPWPDFTIDWGRSALLVIDVQNYSSNVRTGIAEMLLEKRPIVATYYADRIQNTMVPNIARLIDGFRSVGREVIYTRHGALLPDGRDMILRRRRRDSAATAETRKPALWPLGSYEHDIIDELKPEPADLVVDKNSSSPFNGTGIDQLLRNMGIDTLVLSGTATDMCVETTARDAGDRGYNVIVAEDATGTYFHAHHIAALSSIARVFGQVWDTATVLGALRARPGSEGLETSAPSIARR